LLGALFGWRVGVLQIDVLVDLVVVVRVWAVIGG